ncbi:MAG: hypothetical protein RL254_1407, partial [Planctomycetota bacterium]
MIWFADREGVWREPVSKTNFSSTS